MVLVPVASSGICVLCALFVYASLWVFERHGYSIPVLPNSAFNCDGLARCPLWRSANAFSQTVIFVDKISILCYTINVSWNVLMYIPFLKVG